MHALDPRVRKLAAFALLALSLLAIVEFVKAMSGLVRGAVEQLYDARFELKQAKQRASVGRGLLATAVEVEEKGLVPALMWSGATSNGETRFQEIVNQILIGAQFKLEQMRVPPATQLGGLAKVSLDLTGSGTEASLYRTLAQIERFEPIIVVERLVVRSENPAQAGQDNPAGPLLSVEMRLSSFGMTLAEVQSVQPTP